MNVLSLFNGMSGLMMALEKLDVSIDKYYSSEIDKYANQATQALYPGTIQLGDILNWREWDVDWGGIDLVTGGFPCQAWSIAGKQLGDKDERGMLFWTMLDIMKNVKYHNPKVDFLIENVKMKKEFEEYITLHTENALGHVHKILINSALASAQNRNRYYWTSFEVNQPDDKGIFLKDIIDTGEARKITRQCKARDATKNTNAICHHVANAIDIRGNESIRRVYSGAGKSPTLTTMGGGHREPKISINDQHDAYRKLTPRECMRLQTVPEHHIDTLLSSGISNTQLYKMTGNGWTVDVIAHILKNIA